jgi:predicted nucleic acid-binding protein
MVSALFDTNVLIDHLNAYAPATIEIQKYDSRSISIITWMEVLVGATDSNRGLMRQLLASFTLINIDASIAERAVLLRRTRRLKLPDAIIWATAQEHACLLVTRNSKDFPADAPDVRHPYVMSTP